MTPRLLHATAHCKADQTRWPSRIMHATACTLLLALSMAGSAATSGRLVRLEAPAGFEGPVTADAEAGGHAEAYVRRIPGQERGTLLQVTTYDFGSRLKDVPKEELGNGAEHYLLQFLGGIERRRSNFQAARPTRLTLGGLPAARVEWTGVARGESMSGVMFCVIVGTTVVAFHTQGFEDSPAADRAAALRAIEAVRFDAPD